MGELEDRNTMSFGQLGAWAWRETPPVHKSRTNLLIHIVAVPLFVLGHVLLFAGLTQGVVIGDWSLLPAAPVCIVVSLVMQNIGHRLEKAEVYPFLNVRDFVRRIYAEQFFNFWRFLFSGQWYASLKAARA
jgi:hypothetical protein